jgi:pyruvate kinase
LSKLDVIATLNNHLLEPEVLIELANAGATIFRINGAHVDARDVENYAKRVRAVLQDKVKLLIDLPGNKIRTAVLQQPILLTAGKKFELRNDQINYSSFFAHLEIGDRLVANDSLFHFRVEKVFDDRAVFHSDTSGLLTSNKGVHLVGKEINLPFLFERDRQLIRQAVKYDFDYVGFSFVRTPQDVEEASAAIRDTDVKMIIKVETAPAVKNIEEILERADEFLVDRGDLGCDVGIENIDCTQKYVLRRAKAKGKRVYFATQFLHSMVQNTTPLIAEACGLSDALGFGIDGLQLSEETAVGKHPIEVLNVVQKFFSASVARRQLLRRKDTATALVLWLTGRSGAGKTTIAKKLNLGFEAYGLRSCLIDGDEYRDFFGNSGYSKEDRIRNLQNISYTAFESAKVFDVVIVSSLSPYKASREFARARIANFYEIYIDCPQSVCSTRDPKGHYAKAAKGEIASFVGITEEYEVPEAPALTVDTEKLTVEEAVEKIEAFARGKTC